jgi:hypothetical protein
MMTPTAMPAIAPEASVFLFVARLSRPEVGAVEVDKDEDEDGVTLQVVSKGLRKGENTHDAELDEDAEISGQCVNELPFAVALSARIVSRERML